MVIHCKHFNTEGEAREFMASLPSDMDCSMFKHGVSYQVNYCKLNE